MIFKFRNIFGAVNQQETIHFIGLVRQKEMEAENLYGQRPGWLLCVKIISVEMYILLNFEIPFIDPIVFLWRGILLIKFDNKKKCYPVSERPGVDGRACYYTFIRTILPAISFDTSETANKWVAVAFVVYESMTIWKNPQYAGTTFRLRVAHLLQCLQRYRSTPRSILNVKLQADGYTLA